MQSKNKGRWMTVQVNSFALLWSIWSNHDLPCTVSCYSTNEHIQLLSEHIRTNVQSHSRTHREKGSSTEDSLPRGECNEMALPQQNWKKQMRCCMPSPAGWAQLKRSSPEGLTLAVGTAHTPVWHTHTCRAHPDQLQARSSRALLQVRRPSAWLMGL